MRKILSPQNLSFSNIIAYNFLTMNESQQILYMQVRILRMCKERFGLSFKQAAELFRKFNVPDFIEKCFGIFHVEGDDAVFEETKAYLLAKGASL